jgi:hypothetical protein
LRWQFVAARGNLDFEARYFILAHFMNRCPCHGREDDSRNGPESRKKPQRPDTPGMLLS